ncbi:MAG: radical SAM protein [Candidatus Diapherotrites archaeon]|nr:radical SAM protein [Candidatus Diapherotrites archaeon]
MGRQELERTVSVDDKKYLEQHVIVPVPAKYVLDEETGIVYLEKENGTVARVGTKDYWDRIMKYRGVLTADIPEPVRKFEGYGLSCGLCTQHKNSTALMNVIATNMCNLRCWYCFFYSAIAGYVYLPSIKEIEQIYDRAIQIDGYMPPVQITGGEPSLRDDLADMIRLAKEKGAPHVQLNTNSVIFGIEYYEDPQNAPKKIREFVDAGLNTIYTSFDGLDPKTNFKNHYEIPFALRDYYDGGLRSVVLVPTVTGQNLDQMPDVVRFAVHNYKWGIKGVNFQPLSILDKLDEEKRKALRVTQSDVVEVLGELGLGEMDMWFPIPSVQYLADLISGQKHFVHFYNNEKCGLATYAFVDGERLRPITEFIDVDGFLAEVEDLYKSWLKKVYFGVKVAIAKAQGKDPKELALERLDDFIKKDRLPNGHSLKEIVGKALVEGSYDALGAFHDGALFLGMMHFMDYYNYDFNRVQRCDIHYGMPEGVYPFCTFNVYADKYRDALLKSHRIQDPEEEKRWMEFERKQALRVAEFRKHVDEIVEHPIYKEAYGFLKRS